MSRTCVDCEYWSAASGDIVGLCTANDTIHHYGSGRDCSRFKGIRKTEEEGDYMYLRVRFTDNMYGDVVVAALDRMWENIYMNNSPYMGKESKRTISGMFAGLHKTGALQRMLKFAIDCEHNYAKVENCTRGLFRNKPLWERYKTAIDAERFESLSISIGISFHRTQSFLLEQTDGYAAWMNLETGESAQY